MSEKHLYDVIVIGSGPGGYTAAIEAARSGFRTALIEARPYLGGVCLNEGCIPSKTLLSAADILDQIDTASSFGICAEEVHTDWPTLQARREQTIAVLRKGVVQLLRSHNIEVIHGRARLGDSTTVLVDTQTGQQTLDTRYIVLATGSSPVVPDSWQGLEGVVTSTQMLSISSLPESISIIGAGVIGCEFASILTRFGVRVHLVEVKDQVLPVVDPDIAKLFGDRLASQGAELHLGRHVTDIQAVEGGCRLCTDDERKWTSQKVLVAIGRQPNTSDIGLAEAGIQIDQHGLVVIDECLRTTAKNVYCVGDANGKAMLAHAAISQAHHVPRTMHGFDEPYDAVVPWCVYSSPEIAWVGMTQSEAERNGIVAVSGEFPFAALGRAQASHHTEGKVQIIRDVKDNSIIGGQIIGHNATEMINTLALMVAMRIKLPQLHKLSMAHPTLSEGITEAADATVGHALHLPKVDSSRESGSVSPITTSV